MAKNKPVKFEFMIVLRCVLMSELMKINWPAVKKTSFWIITIAGYMALIAILFYAVSPYTTRELINPNTGEVCLLEANVANLEIYGPVYGYRYSFEETEAVSKEIVSQINLVQNMPGIKAILLSIDSPGGDPTAGEEIAAALRSSSKPTYVLISGFGASAAYWAATGASTIFAHQTSEIGSIGVTASYVDNVERNKIEGLTYNELSTGRFKDTGDPNRPLTQEDKELIAKDLEALNNIFIESIAKYRNIPREEVAALADGSTLLGAAAKEKKLIDEVGTYGDLKNRIEREIGEPMVTCW